MNNHVYRYNQFIIKKTDDGFVVINSRSDYKHHSHVKSIHTGKILCKLASKHKLPRNNDIYFIESLIRLTNNTKYLIELNKLKSDIINGTPRKLIMSSKVKNKKDIEEGINEYFDIN